MTTRLTQEQTTRLQDDVQKELEKREWAEAGDLVMAEYICVLLGNGNPADRIRTEMEDLVGSEFDPSFLDWLFKQRDSLVRPPPSPPKAVSPPPVSAPAPTAAPEAAAGPSAGGRMFNSAVEGTKRKLPDGPLEDTNKRRAHEPREPPSGPRAMQGQGQGAFGRDQHGQGRNLADRLGPRGGGPGMPQRGGMSVRGAANGRGPMNAPNMGPGGPQFRPPGFGGFPGQGFMPGQQEMMMQMMAMQANMAQMADQMAKMAEEKRPAARSVRPSPVKVPAGTKLGGHAVSSIQPKGTLGPVPDKPTSTALCKFGVGCSNARCTYSHPSPVADERTGMVLSEEACEAGKDCKDPECVQSHVSPAAVTGASAGPSRVLCKFQNCTNPSCQYRHEDAEGNAIPPPALSKKTSKSLVTSTSEDDLEVVVRPALDTPLTDAKQERPCRFGERCTRADCKFTHPASRPNPRGGKPTRGTPRGGASTTGGEGIVGGMTASKKFAAAAPETESKLNPAAGEFKPASTEPELQVTS